MVDGKGPKKAKSRSIPDSLFRYRSFKRGYEEVIENYLWFSCPLDNNDPFDSWPSLKGCDQDIRESLEKAGFDKEGMMADSFCGDRDMITVGRLLDLLKKFSICCFSRRIDALQLWSLYADNHRGICIEYDISALAKIGSIRRIQYSERMMSEPFRDSIKPDMKEMAKAFFNKSKEYSSEEEWRIVKGSEGGRIDLNDAVEAVYLGTNYRKLDNDDRERLRHLLEFCEKKQIPLFYMRRSFNEYRLTPVRITGDNLPDYGQLERFNLDYFLRRDLDRVSKEGEGGD